MLFKKITFFLLIFFIKITNTRSIHRPYDSKLGYIKLRWENDPKEYTLIDSHLREIPIFHTYNHEHFMENILPEDKIKLRDSSEIETCLLNEMIENLLKEIRNKKKEFTDFKVLKKVDYDRLNNIGTIILKFKNYPLVFKLFMESPKSLSDPYSKAFQARGIFILGGSFRHTLGYTRIQNLNLIKNKIKENPEWKDKIDLPNKWYWLPKDLKWIEITAHNLGNKKEQYIKIPSVYGVVCDEMEGKDNEKLRKSYYNNYLKFCTFLDYTLDAHPNNFILGDKKNILLIDTEHFATLIGIQNDLTPANDYFDWYYQIAYKYIKEKFLSSKKDRRFRQANVETVHPLFYKIKN